MQIAEWEIAMSILENFSLLLGKILRGGVNQYLLHIQKFYFFLLLKPIRYFPDIDSRIYADTLYETRVYTEI